MYKLHWYSVVLNQPVIEIRPDSELATRSLDAMLDYAFSDNYLGRHTVVKMRRPDSETIILIPGNAPEHAMMIERVA